MRNNQEEKEVKFYLQNPHALEKRLQTLNAECIQPRTHELNLRLDTPDRKLSRTSQVLRLRKDVRNLLTYKGPSDPTSIVASRRELEVEVSNFEESRTLLEALGYQVFIQYEKYRTVYRLGKTDIFIDEMPFGNFLEIEGPDSVAIQAMAVEIGLDWEAHSNLSYLVLFEILKKSCNLSTKHILFQLFKGKNFSAQDFGLRVADE